MLRTRVPKQSASTRPLARRRSARARGPRRRARPARRAGGARRDAGSRACARATAGAPRDALGYDDAGGCGFCVLGNAAVAAAEALTSGEPRVAIVDFDVHHGNGTEAWAVTENSERLLYASVHLREVYPENSSLDFFPGTGAAGQHPSVCNVPVTPNWIEPGARERFVAAVKEISRKLAAFGPSLLIISAGFDALEGDAGQLNPWTPDDPDLPPHVSPEVLDGVGLRPEDYGTMTRPLLGVIPEKASVVSILEGGYGGPTVLGAWERVGWLRRRWRTCSADRSRSSRVVWQCKPRGHAARSPTPRRRPSPATRARAAAVPALSAGPRLKPKCWRSSRARIASKASAG